MSHELMVVSIYIIWAILVVLLLAVFALYHHFGQLYVNSTEAKANQGPGLGSSLLSIGGVDMGGDAFALPSDRPTMLLFADTRCEVCASIRDRLTLLEPLHDAVELFVLCSGTERDVAAWSRRVPPFIRVVHDPKMGLAHRFAVNGTPFAIGVTGDGVVRWKGIVSTAEAVVSASEEVLGVASPVGDVPPSLQIIGDSNHNERSLK